MDEGFGDIEEGSGGFEEVPGLLRRVRGIEEGLGGGMEKGLWY